MYDLINRPQEYREPNKAVSRRISFFQNIESVTDEKIVSNLLTRHDNKTFKFKQNVKSLPDRYIDIPVCDKFVSNNLELMAFNHPYTLIGTINEWHEQINVNDISTILASLQLYIEDSEPKKMISLLASIYSMNETDFLIHFKSKHIKTKTILKTWRDLFLNSGYSEKEIDVHMKSFFEKLVSHFPDENWELRKLDDLYLLHVLACAMETRILFMFFAPIFPIGVFSLPIGPTYSKFEIYVVIVSPDKFLLAVPQKKQVNINKHANMKKNEQDQELLKTFETIDKNMAVYFNFKCPHNLSQFESIKAIYKESPTIYAPQLHINFFKNPKSNLELELDLSSANKDNNCLLISIVESISDIIEQKQENIKKKQKNQYIINCKNPYAFCGNEQYFILTRETRKENLVENDHAIVTSQSKLSFICDKILENEYLSNPNNIYSYQETNMQNELNKFLAYRLLYGRMDQEIRKNIFPKLPQYLLYFPQSSRFTLSDCKNSFYGEYLCVLSILKYAAGDVQNISRKCDFCKKLISKSFTLFPIRDPNNGSLRFSCLACIKKWNKNKNKREKYNELFTQYEKMEFEFKIFANARSPDNLNSYINIYEHNIEYISQNPIGNLKEMVPLIKSAFITLQKILQISQRQNNNISNDSILGIRTDYEAAIKIFPIYDEIPEYPVDPKLFSKYLDNQNDIQYSSSQFQLIRSPDIIVSEMDEIQSQRLCDKMKNEGTSRFTVSCNSGLQMKIDFSFDFKHKSFSSINLHKYKLFPIDDASHLSLSPIAEISTDKDIINIWKFEDKKLVILAKNGNLDDKKNNSYYSTMLYIVPIGNINLCYYQPILIYPQSNVICANCFFSFSENIREMTISLETPANFQLVQIQFQQNLAYKVSEIEVSGDPKISNLTYSHNGELYLTFTKLGVMSNNDFQDSNSSKSENLDQSSIVVMSYDDFLYYNSSKSENIDSILEQKFSDLNERNKVKIISTPMSLVFLSKEGKITEFFQQSEENEEDIDEEQSSEKENELFNSNGEKISDKYPLFFSYQGNKPGIASIISLFDHNQDNLKMVFYPYTEQTNSHNISFGSLFKNNEPMFNQYGLKSPKNLKSKKFNINMLPPNRSLPNIYLTIAELLPVLVAYSSGDLKFIIRKNMDSYRPDRINFFMPSAIYSHYIRSYSALSFHHIEDVILSKGSDVKITSFLGDMSDYKIAQFADTIFGTRLSSTIIPGVWAGLRVVGNTAHIILYFKGKSNISNDLQYKLIASYFDANNIYICTEQAINGLNFLDNTFMALRKAFSSNTSRSIETQQNQYHPNMNLAFFSTTSNEGINQEAFVAYKDSHQIPSQIFQIPFMDSWNKQSLFDEMKKATEEEEDEDEDESIIPSFYKKMENLINGKVEDRENHRPNYKSEEGISKAKKIIATYLTLSEYNDIPLSCVLKNCKL